jgi:hypothetical protein
MSGPGTGTRPCSRRQIDGESVQGLDGGLPAHLEAAPVEVDGF